MKLEGKVALITGGARGIGYAIARAFDAKGAAVVLADLHEAGLEQVAGSLAKARTVAVDLTETARLDRVVEATVDAFGRLDVLVNNAGVFLVRPRDEMTLLECQRLFALNLDAPFFLGRAAARVMVRQRSGNIINVSSVAGYYPRADQAAYCASKAGLEHLTRVFALELAPYGVRANALRPGVVETEMAVTSSAPSGSSGSRSQFPSDAWPPRGRSPRLPCSWRRTNTLQARSCASMAVKRSTSPGDGTITPTSHGRTE